MRSRSLGDPARSIALTGSIRRRMTRAVVVFAAPCSPWSTRIGKGPSGWSAMSKKATTSRQLRSSGTLTNSRSCASEPPAGARAGPWWRRVAGTELASPRGDASPREVTSITAQASSPKSSRMLSSARATRTKTLRSGPSNSAMAARTSIASATDWALAILSECSDTRAGASGGSAKSRPARPRGDRKWEPRRAVAHCRRGRTPPRSAPQDAQAGRQRTGRRAPRRRGPPGRDREPQRSARLSIQQALQQTAAVVSLADRQRWLGVVVRRAKRHPARASGSHLAKPVKHSLHWSGGITHGAGPRPRPARHGEARTRRSCRRRRPFARGSADVPRRRRRSRSGLSASGPE